jgi:hypothetical protein
MTSHSLLLWTILIWSLVIAVWSNWWYQLHKPRKPQQNHLHQQIVIAIQHESRESSFTALTHILTQCPCKDVHTLRTISVLGCWTPAELGIRDPIVAELERMAAIEAPADGKGQCP